MADDFLDYILFIFSFLESKPLRKQHTLMLEVHCVVSEVFYLSTTRISSNFHSFVLCEKRGLRVEFPVDFKFRVGRVPIDA